jgi:hypothetical protein
LQNPAKILLLLALKMVIRTAMFEEMTTSGVRRLIAEFTEDFIALGAYAGCKDFDARRDGNDASSVELSRAASERARKRG